MSIRPLSETDRPQVESWIQAEPEHASNTFDWYTGDGAKSVIYEDSDGQVLVAKFTPCLRVDIDFNPTASASRIGRAVASGLKETAESARQQGFKEFVFESRSPKLIAFCKALGYEESPGFRKVI